MDKTKIKDITFGLLFKKSFRIMDMWGSIADDILRKDKYFSPKYFPSIQSQYNLQGQLSNPETGNYLLLSAENLIYRHSIEKSFDEEFKLFRERISKYLVPDIVFENHLEVIRVGLVYSYILNQEEVDKFISNVFKPSVKGLSDFRYSKKEPVTTGGTIKGVNDYNNKIYTVGSLGEEKKGITYDYQLIFSPHRECVNDIIEKFLLSSYSSFEKEMGNLVVGQ